ncbi:tetratricopeptide repeat protein [Deferribacter thermophilus]|uniref:CheR family methyltransferase n=1 Tax=Deferribacter thermophilus TaxID=53573 RepID=UPI003C17EFFE
MTIDCTDNIISLVKSFSGLNIVGSIKDNFNKTLSKWIDYYKSSKNVYELLRNDRTALFNFLSEITINESFFYRNKSHFTILKTIINNLQNKNIKILSIGCSNGCEPYTIAIELIENFGINHPTSIVGIDISKEQIEHAKTGIYQKWYLRNTPLSIVDRYFDKIDENNYKIKDFVKKNITFLHKNLFEFDEKNFDIVYCRNILIYFDKEDTENTIKKIDEITNKHATIIFGNSDILSVPINTFERYEIDGVTVFKKKTSTDETSEKANNDKIKSETIIKKQPIITDIKIRTRKNTEKSETELFDKALAHFTNNNYDEAAAIFRKIFENLNPTNNRAKIFYLICLIKQNLIDDAENFLNYSIDNNILSYELFLIKGILNFYKGDYENSKNELRKSIYLKTDSSPAWFYYGLALLKLNERDEAKKAFEKALMFLDENTDNNLIYISELSADGLKNIINSYLSQLN